MEKGHPFSNHIKYLFTFFIRANGFIGSIMIVSAFIYLPFAFAYIFTQNLESLDLSILISLFLLYLVTWLQLLTHPDNVKCPNCKSTRVDNTILRKQNLGHSSTRYTKHNTYIYHRICTTYKCIKCGYTFNKECCRTLESYQ